LIKDYLAMAIIAAMLLSAGASSATPKSPQEGNESQEQEKRVRMKDLPPAVQKTVREQSKGAKILGLAQEIENGKTNYEVELKVDGHHKDVLIDPAGAVVVIEEEVTLESLPPLVKATILQHVGKGKIGMIESITEGGAVVAYEAHIRKAKKTTEIKVSPSGEVIP